MSPYIVLHGSLTIILLMSLLLTLFLPLVCISIYIYRPLAVMVELMHMEQDLGLHSRLAEQSGFTAMKPLRGLSVQDLSIQVWISR